MGNKTAIRLQTTGMIGGWLLLVALFWGAGPVVLAAAATEEPRETVARAVAEMVEILTDQELAGDENSARRYQMVADLVEVFFDFREISMRTLGPRWRELDEEERQKFVALFKKYLEKNYIDRVDEYSGEDIRVRDQEIREDRRGNRFARVVTDFIMQDKVVPINYRLRELDDRWVVYDVDIEGISLVRNFRSQFEPYAFDELIRRMEKNITTGEEMDIKP